MTLEELFKEIYSKHSDYVWGWYKDFKPFVERVRNRIEEIKNGRAFDVNNVDDKDILQNILVEVKNGVMDVNPYRGLNLTKDKWADYIINNKPFIDSLQDYMKNPDDESYFNELYKNCDPKPVSIINRIAATCTQNVSTTVKVEDIDQIVNYLENEKIIPKDSVPKKGTWFTKNVVLMKVINEQLANFTVDGKPLDDYQKVIFVWLIKIHCIDKKQDATIDKKQDATYEEYINLLKANYNLILTGAPGTGKTYLAKQIAMKMIGAKDEKELENNEQYEFIQFHPSYDYTDFVEGLRPIKKDEASNEIGFELKPGIFKQFCEKAKITEFKLSGGVDNFNEAWEKFISKVEESNEEGEPYKEAKTLQGREMKLQLTDRRNSVELCLQKPHNLDKECFYNVYRGLSGWPSESLDNYIKAVILHLKEKFNLKDYSEGHSSSNDQLNGKKYIFVIDEINRGEISKIFGELFFSIDPGYRGKDGAVKTQYSNMHDDDEKFYIPENVYIIGTMNDIDRSVESFDFAMRRRFTWKEITAEQSAENMNLNKDAKERMVSLNKAIENIEGLNSSYHIGAAYFLKLKNYDGDYDELWEYHLEPLIKEYLRGMPDAEKKENDLKNAYDLKTNKSDANNGQ